MENQQRRFSKEVFKQHPQYPTIEVSNLGNIRRTSNKEPKYKCLNKQGYFQVVVKIKGKPKSLKLHRLVAELFLPEPDERLINKCSKEHHGKVLVKHLDNDKTNNHFSNLCWSDSAGNTKQAWDDGLIPALKGELNGRSVLTEDIVHQLCKDYQDGMMPKAATEKYGISRQQATKIRAGYQWKHVWEQYDIKVNRREQRSSTIRKE